MVLLPLEIRRYQRRKTPEPPPLGNPSGKRNRRNRPPHVLRPRLRQGRGGSAAVADAEKANRQRTPPSSPRSGTAEALRLEVGRAGFAHTLNLEMTRTGGRVLAGLKVVIGERYLAWILMRAVSVLVDRGRGR